LMTNSKALVETFESIYSSDLEVFEAFGRSHISGQSL
jgi:hypothetical protein